MTEWWQRVGQGTAGGISKIMLAEARQFPELARFYVDEVVTPTHRLLGGLIERGVASGEFRPVPVAETVHVLIGPMLHMMLYEHSFRACRMHGPRIDPAAVLVVQMDLMMRGLAAAPEPSQRPANSAVDAVMRTEFPVVFPLKDPSP
ncbi:TetR-like C-terminal domain-containing protein [Roseateles sp. GG27B]